MSLRDLKPDPPDWALEAGLPKPRRKESFSEYVTRLGFTDDLLDELTDCTACIANIRLASRLQRAMPDVFDAYVDTLAARFSSDPLQVENAARRLFGENFRQRRRPVVDV